MKRYAVDRAAGEAVDRQRVAIAGNRAVGDAHDHLVELGIVDVGEGGERGERNRALRSRHRRRSVSRVTAGRVVHRHDSDHCGCHITGVHAVADDHLDEAVFGGGIVAGVAVANLQQRSFVLVQRGRAGEREHAGRGIVGGSDDANRQRPGDGQQIAGLLVRQRDRRGHKRGAVEIGDGDICVGDRYRRPVFRENRPESGPSRGARVIGIEVDHRRAVVHRLDLDKRRRDVAVG